MNICLNCKKEFIPPFGRKCYYCSDECRKETKRKARVERQKKYNKAFISPHRQQNAKPQKNNGYSDPTAFEVIKSIDNEEDERFHKLLYSIRNICDLAGYDLGERIVLIDRRNGRIWR